MSDRVEIVAAEDAPSNTEGGEAIVPAQNNPEQPEPTTEAMSQSESAPVAEAVSETVETEDEPLMEGPVGEVLDDSNDNAAEATPESHALSQPEAMAEKAETEDEPLMEGPVGEVLDDSNDGSNDGAVAEAAADSSTASSAPSEAESGKSNVRILSVGQQVSGTVKRIADFGAFVDIGVGRDGLIHISELSVRRVGKVTDVLTEGQEVTAWIKKLDRERNRISLTSIDPNTKTIRDLNKDDLVQGTVTRILPYGAFVDIGIGRDALLHVREMGVGYVAKPEDVVKVGDSIEARIIELSRRRGRVDLSLKGLREEPEPTPPPMPEPAQPQPQPSSSRRRQEPEPEPEYEDEEDLEDLEVLSPMELAFKRAMEAEGVELNISRKKQSKRNRRERNRSLQDEIIARTLSTGRK
jgi:predicted RNA-binding protein with RPS1 domain